MHPTSLRSPYGPSLSSSSDRASTCLSGAHSAVTLSGSMIDSNKFIEIGAGEAAWQAPEQAGYIRTVTVTKEDGTEALEPQFISAPSAPWWNDYSSFRQDLKLKAKGFSIVPEFRMSENMDDYLKSDGKVADGFGFGLEIPHMSGANSRTDQKFYTTYTNSEFLKDFLRIRDTSLLKASEIRISCTGAIRLNPYKGFYPAQRTLDLAKEFKNSYSKNLSINIIGGLYASGSAAQVAPGTGSFEALQTANMYHPFVATQVSFNQSNALKPLINKLFAPGILYNSIKSGLAVDYPTVNDAKKLSPTNFYHKTQLF